MSAAAATTTPAQRAGVALTLVLAGLAMLGPFSIDTPFPAFTAMGQEFGVGVEPMQLVVSLYLLAFAAMSPFHGPLSDAVGRRPVILTGLGVYAIASVGAALSHALPSLLAFRVLQGLSAGGATIIGRTIVRDLLEGPAAQKLMSRVMMIFGLAPAIAPIIGGWLLKVGPWPSIFFFIAGFALLMIGAVLLVIPETHPPERRTPFRFRAMLSSLVRVARNGEFERMSWAITLSFAGQFLYIGAAAIFIVDLLGKGPGDFWMFFVPMISGVVVGAWISSHAAGRISGRRLVTVALSGAVLAGVVGIVLAAIFGPRLPYAVIGPMLIALGTGTAFPTVQIALLDLFPESRGAAASMAGMMPLTLNAVLATALVPLVTGSVLEMAAASTVLVVAGLAFWIWHLRSTRTEHTPPPDSESHEPLDQM